MHYTQRHYYYYYQYSLISLFGMLYFAVIRKELHKFGAEQNIHLGRECSKQFLHLPTVIIKRTNSACPTQRLFRVLHISISAPRVSVILSSFRTRDLFYYLVLKRKL